MYDFLNVLQHANNHIMSTNLLNSKDYTTKFGVSTCVNAKCMYGANVTPRQTIELKCICNTYQDLL